MIRVAGCKDDWDRRVKRLGILELKLAQLGAMAVAFVIAKLWPRILELHLGWFVAVWLGCAAVVCRALWAGPDDPEAERRSP